MSFSKNVFEVFGTKLITIFISLLSGVILARYLAPHDRGLYSLLLTFPIILGTISSLGLAPANIYFMKRDSNKAPQIVSNALLLALGIGFVACAFLIIFRGIVTSTILKGVPTNLYLIILILCPFVLMDKYFMNILRGLEKFRIYNFRLLITRILSLLGITILLVVFPGGLFEVTVFNVLLIIAINAWLVYTINRFIPLKRTFNFRLFRNTLSYGLKFYVQTIANSLHLKIDIFMLAFYLDLREVAYYALAVGLVQMLFHFPNSVGLVLMPKLIGKEKRELHNFTAQVCRNTLFLTILPAVFILLFGEIIITFLYGIEYVKASQAIPFLVPGIILMCIYKILGRSYTASNKHQVTAIAGAVGLIINVIANIILIPKMGIKGAALATTISYSITSVIVLVHFLKDTGLRLRQTLLVNCFDLNIYKDKFKQLGSNL